MNRMLELIRTDAVPTSILKKALLGQLALPVAEQLEILVFLASRDEHAEEAVQTLTNWDHDSLRDVCADPNTPREVLHYFLLRSLQRRSPHLSALLDNSSVEDEMLANAAREATNEQLHLFLQTRACSVASVLRAVLENSSATVDQRTHCRQLLEQLSEPSESAVPDDGESEVQGIISQYEQEHASEIALEEGKTFELTRGHPDEQDEIAELLDAAVAPSTAGTAKAATRMATAKRPDDLERMSVLQKIARLKVGERVQLAMKGNKDERFILIRDGARVVSLAVLESPKITDSEVESFAAMKNVQELVLRGIASKRKFMKKYSIIRALVTNPKTPLDLGLSLLPHLLVADLKNLSANKNVGETLRKVATKLWHDKHKKS